MTPEISCQKVTKKVRQEPKLTQEQNLLTQEQNLPTQQEVIEKCNFTENELLEIKVTNHNHSEEKNVKCVEKVVLANPQNIDTDLIENPNMCTEKIPEKVSTFSLVTDYSSSSNDSD